jgi:hypothetical protein
MFESFLIREIEFFITDLKVTSKDQFKIFFVSYCGFCLYNTILPFWKNWDNLRNIRTIWENFTIVVKIV